MSATTSSGTSSASDNSVTDGDSSFKFANKTLQDYEVISVIGNGTFGTCFKVRDKQTGELYAWKGIDYDELSESKKASLVSEIRVLRQLQHPNIVQYYHHLVNHEAKSIFIVMECCEGGDLAQLIKHARTDRKRFEERYIWRVLFQVCKALQVCHNKIRKGTILHRDIKPANIFLDAQGNAKLGDFGLARMLRKNQDFAATFVGTPYYMSPEIVKGSKYDRKSDVWAVGCLAYEMCALRTPFQAPKFDELTLNISNGKFSHIPDVYSGDLREIIAYMLSVDSEQRPSIEVITRHPIVVRNITELGNEFPSLIKAEADFFAAEEKPEVRCKLQYSPIIDLSSTMYTEQNSFNDDYGQRRLSCGFTPDLRAELFSSVKRRIFSKSMLQRSDPELYETIQHEYYVSVKDQTPLRPPIPPPKPPSHARASANSTTDELKSPALITEDVFNEALLGRLRAIRAHESLLQQRTLSLDARTQELNERERRLGILEETLRKRDLELTAREMALAAEVNKAVENSNAQIKPVPSPSPPPPPIPPRKSSINKHDETYCSIEDTQLESPTIAKLSLPFAMSLPTLRRVTFQSPQKFTNYDIDSNPCDSAQINKPISTKAQSTKRQPSQLQGSVSSKDSRDSADSGIAANSTTTSTHTRRRSILSTLFGLHRSSKSTSKPDNSNRSKGFPESVLNNKKNNQQPPPNSATTKTRMPFAPRADQVLAKCETSELGNIWTKEHKRAAFDLLAAMNADQSGAETAQCTAAISNTAATNTVIGRQKFRQSTRERHSATLRRHHHMRRSLMLPPHSITHVAAASAGAVSSMRSSGSREKMLV
ncbi:serine/threonine-protein kinase dst1 [Rhagoletis pomonella]|uniref:serine/threonine-protein kinase dst1 n=1 Tax=Rhagoletis pomonella TaxID=28610 RepID=UPI0017871BEA|nr:serine/threonine-protein kinase dst1 [Rhagoletis pomonella]